MSHHNTINNMKVVDIIDTTTLSQHYYKIYDNNNASTSPHTLLRKSSHDHHTLLSANHDITSLLQSQSHEKSTIISSSSVTTQHQHHTISSSKLTLLQRRLDNKRMTMPATASPSTSANTTTNTIMQNTQQNSHHHQSKNSISVSDVYELSHTQPINDTSSMRNQQHHITTNNTKRHIKSNSDDTTNQSNTQHNTTLPTKYNTLRPRAISTGGNNSSSRSLLHSNNNNSNNIQPINILQQEPNTGDDIYSSNINTIQAATLPTSVPMLQRYMSASIHSHSSNNSTQVSCTTSPNRALRTLKNRMKNSRVSTPNINNNNTNDNTGNSTLLDMFSPVSAPIRRTRTESNASVNSNHNNSSLAAIGKLVQSPSISMKNITPTHNLHISQYRRRTMPNIHQQQQVTQRASLTIINSARSITQRSNSETTSISTTPSNNHHQHSIIDNRQYTNSSSRSSNSTNSNTVTLHNHNHNHNHNNDSIRHNNDVQYPYSNSCSPYTAAKIVNDTVIPTKDQDNDISISNNSNSTLNVNIISTTDSSPLSDHRHISPVQQLNSLTIDVDDSNNNTTTGAIKRNPFGLKLMLNSDDDANTVQSQSTQQQSFQIQEYNIDNNENDNMIPVIELQEQQQQLVNNKLTNLHIRRSSSCIVPHVSNIIHNDKIYNNDDHNNNNNSIYVLGSGYEINQNGLVAVPNVYNNDNVTLDYHNTLDNNTLPIVLSSSTTDDDNTSNSATHSCASSDCSVNNNNNSNNNNNMLLTSPPSIIHTTTTRTTIQSQHRRITKPQRQATLGVAIKSSDLVKLGELGRGATGVVYKALYIPTLQIVALKSVRIDNKDDRLKMVSELKAFHTIHNNNILSFIGAVYDSGKLTMVLEYMNRGSLDQVIKSQGQLNENNIRNIAKQVLTGLHSLHSAHTVHRDIKPANILIDAYGQCKISDFGLLRQLDNTSAMCNTFVGTLMYLSPERVVGDKFSYPSDIWSLGLSLMYCAMTSLPVPRDYWTLVRLMQDAQNKDKNDNNNNNHDNNSSINNDNDSPFQLDNTKFSNEFCDFIHCCMRTNPERRSTAAQLLLHPFITNIQHNNDDDSTDSDNQQQQYIYNQTTNTDELNKLVDIVLQHYYSDIDSWQEYNSVNIARIKHIGNQLGCNENIVADVFKQKFIQRKTNNINNNNNNNSYINMINDLDSSDDNICCSYNSTDDSSNNSNNNSNSNHSSSNSDSISDINDNNIVPASMRPLVHNLITLLTPDHTQH